MGVNLHYIDERSTENTEAITYVCLHGNPSSSHLWRNIIPHLRKLGRVVCPDLIGFGKSDKPDIDYKVKTHFAYLSAFINQLDLQNIIFILHDWGTALGLAYARQNEEKIAGVVFMEGIVKPLDWSFGNPMVRLMFKSFRVPYLGKWLIIKRNFFVKRVLLFLGTKKALSKIDKQIYSLPFENRESRFPVYVFPNEIPINGKPEDVFEFVNSNHNWMKKTRIPKLLLWVKPGLLIKEKDVNEMKSQYSCFQSVLIGNSSFLIKESHYMPEDFPEEIVQSIVNWRR